MANVSAAWSQRVGGTVSACRSYCADMSATWCRLVGLVIFPIASCISDNMTCIKLFLFQCNHYVFRALTMKLLFGFFLLVLFGGTIFFLISPCLSPCILSQGNWISFSTMILMVFVKWKMSFFRNIHLSLTFFYWIWYLLIFLFYKGFWFTLYST